MRRSPTTILARIRHEARVLGCLLFGHRFITRRVPINGWRSTTRHVRVSVRCVRCGAIPAMHAPHVLVRA